MHWYRVVETDKGPMVEILYADNVIDECGPWETLVAAINWAEQYTSSKNSGLVEPQIA